MPPLSSSRCWLPIHKRTLESDNIWHISRMAHLVADAYLLQVPGGAEDNWRKAASPTSSSLASFGMKPCGERRPPLLRAICFGARNRTEHADPRQTSDLRSEPRSLDGLCCYRVQDLRDRRQRTTWYRVGTGASAAAKGQPRREADAQSRRASRRRPGYRTGGQCVATSIFRHSPRRQRR